MAEKEKCGWKLHDRKSLASDDEGDDDAANVADHHVKSLKSL